MNLIDRPTVRPSRGANDVSDWRRILHNRLVALQYTLDSSGDVVDSSGNVIVSADDTSNTGQTPSDLAALGYTPDQIAQLAGSVAPNVSGQSGGTALNQGGGPPASGSSTGWLSGLSSLFSSIGTTVTNVSRASSNPRVNPSTGLPYGVNPATGLPYTSPVGSNSIVTLAIIFGVLYLILRK